MRVGAVGKVECLEMRACARGRLMVRRCCGGVVAVRRRIAPGRLCCRRVQSQGV